MNNCLKFLTLMFNAPCFCSFRLWRFINHSLTYLNRCVVNAFHVSAGGNQAVTVTEKVSLTTGWIVASVLLLVAINLTIQI